MVALPDNLWTNIARECAQIRCSSGGPTIAVHERPGKMAANCVVFIAYCTAPRCEGASTARIVDVQLDGSSFAHVFMLLRIYGRSLPGLSIATIPQKVVVVARRLQYICWPVCPTAIMRRDFCTPFWPVCVHLCSHFLPRIL